MYSSNDVRYAILFASNFYSVLVLAVEGKYNKS